MYLISIVEKFTFLVVGIILTHNSNFKKFSIPKTKRNIKGFHSIGTLFGTIFGTIPTTFFGIVPIEINGPF